MLTLPVEQVIDNVSSLLSQRGLFLESSCLDKDNHHSFFFRDPFDILTLTSKESPETFFRKVQDYIFKGYWVAGYFSYELGYLFEPVLKSILDNKQIDFPLAWIGVFSDPSVTNHKDISKLSNHRAKNKDFNFSKDNYNMDFREYKESLDKIKMYLEQGDTYQVNHTLKYEAKLRGDLGELYLQLRNNQPTSYSAMINDGRRLIFSFSPELFFRTSKDTIIVRPMKGTHKRGRFYTEDKEFEKFLANDEKNKAENIMIVDLLRNDLGKISCDGSVQTEKLFKVEKHPSLFQMTSDIKATLKKGLSLFDIFKALFPSGSVTGAPKIRTMQIIEETEKDLRDVYTGAIGFISPYMEKSCFNVAIRTLIIQQENLKVGIGSGIVYDSNPESEYKECLLKAKFLTQEKVPFSLLETILWEKGEFRYLRLHLNRLKESARFFGMRYNPEEIKKKLTEINRDFQYGRKYKVRVSLKPEGFIDISFSLLDKEPQEIKVKLSCKRVSSQDVYLYHKTTHRDFYDKELKESLKQGFFETLFLNEKGQLTEGTRTNLFLYKGKKLYTPDLSSGLLPGILRGYLLNRGESQEKVLYPKDLEEAEKIFLGNSVRGLIYVDKTVFSKEKTV